MKPPIQNIELIRKEKNISRDEIAKKLDVTLSNYGKIERGEISLSLERLYDLAVIFKMQPEEILTYNKPSKGNVTYVPIEAQAGFLAGHTQEQINSYKTYNLPFIEGHNLYMIDAVGDSMLPTIAPGDHLIIEQATDPKRIKFGRAHVIVAKDGLVIKRLYTHDNPKKFLLKSDNMTYEPYEILKDDVISLWLVRDYLLTHLTPRNHFVNIIQEYNRNILGKKDKNVTKKA